MMTYHKREITEEILDVDKYNLTPLNSSLPMT